MRGSVEIEIIGYVGKDPIFPSPEKYPDFITFEVGVTINKNQVNWFKCQTSSEGLVNVIKSYVKKGDGVLIKGYPKVSAYIGKDGKAKAQFGININYLNLLTNSNSSNENFVTEAPPVLLDSMLLDDDNIPF